MHRSIMTPLGRVTPNRGCANRSAHGTLGTDRRASGSFWRSALSGSMTANRAQAASWKSATYNSPEAIVRHTGSVARPSVS